MFLSVANKLNDKDDNERQKAKLTNPDTTFNFDNYAK